MSMNVINTPKQQPLKKSANASVSFKGAEGFIEKSLINMAKSDTFRKMSEWGAKDTGRNGWGLKTSDPKKTVKGYDMLQKHAASAVAVLLSALYLVNTAKSKDIEHDRKPALMANMALTTVFSTVGGYTISNKIASSLDKLKTKIKVAHKIPSNQIGSFNKGFKLAFDLIVFSAMFRFIGPVVATPLANKLINGNKPVEK